MPIVEEVTRIARKVISFKYLQSIGLMSEGLNLGEQVGTTTGSRVQVDDAEPIESISESGKSIFRVSTASDSGWQMDSMDFISKNDRARYAIGLRDIYVGNTSYGIMGQTVSRIYSLPGNLDKVQLLAEEAMPLGFDRDKVWIQYHIIIESKAVEIVPTNRVYGSGAGVPRTIYINRDPDEGDKTGLRLDVADRVTDLRIKFTIKRPSDVEGASPLIKGFRLKATVL